MNNNSSAFSRLRWKDAERTRLEGLRRSLQLTDRILSGNTDIRLKFGDVNHNRMRLTGYAMSYGNDITVNTTAIKHPTSAEGIASILGLNYHELAHVFFSPGSVSNLSSAYVPSGAGRQSAKVHTKFGHAYRILEEGRIETLMGAKYPNMRKYFAYPIFSIMLKGTSQEELDNRHLLLHGRRYLPRKIRDTYRKFFEQKYGETAAREFEKLIDEYRVIPLTSAGEYTKAAYVIQKFAKLLEKYNVVSPDTHDESGGSSDSGDLQEQQQVAQKAKEETKEQDKKEKDPDTDGSGFNQEKEEGEGDEQQQGSGSDADDDSSDGSGEEDSSDSSEDGSGSGDDQDQDGSGEESSGSGSEASDGKQSGSSKDVEGSDSSKRSNPSSSQRSGSGVGRGSDPIDKTPETFSKNDLKQALADLMDDVLDDEEVSSEISRFQNAMDDQRGMGSILGVVAEKNEKYFRSVTPEMINRSGRISDELRQIWAKMDSGWNYGTSEGPRLNMERASLAQEPEDYESIYDDWEPGQQENSGLEVVIMGDRSGSMASQIYPPGTHYYDYDYDEMENLPDLVKTVSKNIWELMHALQEIDAHVTVLTYDSYCYTLYERGELVSTAGYYELKAQGGTSPTDAFNEARRILGSSEMPNKLLVNFTDGSWSASQEEIGDTLGMLTDTVKVAALLGSYGVESFDYRSYFDVVKETSGDILDIMATAVVEIIQRSSE